MSLAAHTDEYALPPADSLTLDEFVFGSTEIPTVPQIVMRLGDLTSHPKSNSAEIERVIHLDQGIAARVLALANTESYGLPHRISTVKEAIVFLGYKSLNNLSTQIAGFNNFLGKSDAESLSRRNLWKHSIFSGLCSKIICNWLRPMDAKDVDPEEAFTAALLHDMGKLAILRVMPQAYADAEAAAAQSQVHFHNIESDYFPYTHAFIGYSMAERWKLPDSLCDAILNHHTPLDSQTSPQLAAVVTLADEITQGLHDKVVSGESDEPESDPVGDAVAILGFSNGILHDINKACRLEMDKGIRLDS